MPDLSTVGGPALSAISDTPVDVAEAVGETIQTTEASITDAPEAETKVETPTVTEAPKVEEEAKKATTSTEAARTKDGINQRFSDLTKQRNDANARAEKLALDLEIAIGKLNEIGSKTEADKLAAEAAADKKPEKSDFDVPEAYDKALEDWGIRQGRRQAEADITKRQADEKAEADKKAAEDKQTADREAAENAWNDTVKTYNDRRTKALDSMPDYETVAEGDHVKITFPMRDAILTSEIGPQIAYHLGKNPEESARIAALAPFQQIKEMGRLEERISRQRSNVSKAPDPITPSGGRETAGPKDINAMSGDEYFEHRMAQQRAKR